MSKRHLEPTSPEKPDPSPAKISRRAFGRHAAVAAYSLSPAALMGRPAESAGTATHASSPQTDKATRDAAPPAGEAAQTVDAKLANVIRKYGDRLSEEQRQHLRRILVYNERMMDGIRAVSLQNGDPPASVLRNSFAPSADANSQPPALQEKR